MMKLLLRVGGVLIVVGGLAAAWFGIGANDDISGLEGNINTTKSEIAGKRRPLEKGESEIANFEREIWWKKTERNGLLGVATVALIVGFGLILLPSSPKRKVSSVAVVPNPEARTEPSEAIPGSAGGAISPAHNVENPTS
jgi:hypothetical protein